MSVNVPVGAIVAYCGDRNALKNTNWRICDGTRLDQKQYPELFTMIGVANGGDTTSFQLPDLRGRFLRGASPDEEPRFSVGQAHGFKTANGRSSFKIELFNVPNYSQNAACSKGTMIQMMDVFSRDFKPTLDGNDKETRPDNMYMDFIIKLQNKSPGIRTNDLVAGSVFPYSGHDEYGPTSDIDGQFVLCNGDNVVAAKYPALRTAVGNRFTANKQLVDNFTPPNLQGLFIRGIDDTGVRDPDYQVRQAAPDGSDGRGSTQKWATHIKNPRYSLNALNQTKGSSSGCTKAAGVTAIAHDTWAQDANITGGDEETRPRNTAMRFYLNAVDPTADRAPTLPIGGIIALPGTPDTKSKKWFDRDFPVTWLKCDGSLVKVDEYEDLSKLYKDGLWTDGASVDKGLFRLPNLKAQYLRGTGPTYSRRTGSRQDWATGKPAKLSNNPLGEWPHDDWNIAAGGGNRVFEATKTRTLDIEAEWDNETAPATVVVDFYVRAS